jgi:hypothetical protein
MLGFQEDAEFGPAPLRDLAPESFCFGDKAR